MQKNRQTDMTKLIVALCNFSIVSKNVSYPWRSLIILIFVSCIFLKTSFHSGRKCLPQNDGLYTHHGQPLQSYSMPRKRIKLKNDLFS